MKQQASLLLGAKQAKAIAPLIEATPFARLCRSCGRRPAVDILTGLAGERPRYLCRVCAQNDDWGRHKKSAWHDRFEEWHWRYKGQALKADMPADLQTIGASAQKRGYVGFIYADGNRIGRWLESAASLKEYGQRSYHLKAAMATAVYGALAQHLVEKDSVRPFEIITIGGDDALLIVPADTALPIARDLCHTFSETLARRVAGASAPTMSAGVVLAHDSNPIYFLSDLARQLLKNAKRRTSRDKVACVDFMVLKSQSTVATNLLDVRTSPTLLVEDDRDAERCYLTGRPYTLAELGLLLDSARELGRVAFSPGQLHQMRHNFQLGRFPGLFHYLYQRARFSHEHRQVLQGIERSWQMAEPDGASPWRFVRTAENKYAEYNTPFLDMLELRDFLKKEDARVPAN
jgi:CRISPR-associated protein Cmr2